MPEVLRRGIEQLQASLAGPVLWPGDRGYEDARSIWNGDIDRRPALIACCTSPADVAAAVSFAQECRLELSVRGGGHSFSGASVCDGGLMIDLSAMRDVTVDPVARRARVGGGATMADLDAATQAHGLAVTGGIISHTGVGGLILGGGMGWLANKAGLAIDNLVSAEVVLADGRVVRTSPRQHPDLFWALRGGGGNFGVVTEFELDLHRVGPIVHAGLFFWSLDRGQEVLSFLRSYLPALPRDAGAMMAAGLSAPPAPFVPERFHFTPGHALIVVGFSSPEAHAELAAPVREAVQPLFEWVTPIPYSAMQGLLDDSAPWGIRAYDKALDLQDLSDDAIEVVDEQARKKSSPMSFIEIVRLGGAFASVGDDDTAFGGSRSAHYVLGIHAVAPTPELIEADRRWARSTWDALRPHAMGSGSYVNYLTETEPDRVRAVYGHKYERLARIKAAYDPENVFRRNVNIVPAVPA